MKPFDQHEQEFLRSVSWEPDELQLLVKGAPPASAEAQARIRALTIQKLGLETEPTAQRQSMGGGLQKPRPWSRRWLPVAAAVVLLATGAALVTASPSAQAALERLRRLIPGFGITETQRDTLVLAEPVKVAGDRGGLTVTALISTGEHTVLRFRIDGLPAVKPDPKTMDQERVRATLILPSGSRLELNSAETGAGLNEIKGTLSFPPLPADVRTVTLELSQMHGLTTPYSATLKVVDVASAGLTNAVAGGWSGKQSGMVLGIPFVAFEPDKTTLTLEGILDHRGARVSHVGGANNAVSLTDDLGNSYSLMPQESQLDDSSVRGIEGVFAGPVHQRAKALHLTVDAVQVAEEGEARLQVSLDRLPTGQTVPINKELKIGARKIVVRSVSRLAEDRFALELDLGPAQGPEVVQYLAVQPYHMSGGSSLHFDPVTGTQATDFEVSYTPQGKYLDLQFSRPIVQLAGPWRIDLPVK